MVKELKTRVDEYFNQPLKAGEKRKILYLYDSECTYLDQLQEMSQESEQFILLRITNQNYFKTQYQIERELAHVSLFLYFEMEKPSPKENPLLDVLFYSEELKVDQESQLFLSIGIDPNRDDLARIVKSYSAFFKNKARINRMKRLWEKVPFDTAEYFEYSIQASLVKAENADWMSIWIALFEEEAQDTQDKWDQLLKFGNVDRFWDQVDELIGYNNETSTKNQKSIKDMMIQIFYTHLNAELEGQLPKELRSFVLSKANPVIVFINQWMNTKNQDQSYQFVSTIIQDECDFPDLFGELSSKTLSQLETFQWFDRELITRMIEPKNRVETDEQLNWIAQRRNTFWYPQFKKVYQLLKNAVYLNQSVKEAESEWLNVQTQEELLRLYTKRLYKLDQQQRKMNRLFEIIDSEWQDCLSKQVENWNRLYNKKYLEPLTDKWTRLVEAKGAMISERPQADFYRKAVLPYINSQRRIVVIISDGLRYEVGEDLFTQLTSEKRFNGELEWMQTDLPSVTSLGMANLLPHDTIKWIDTGEVQIDGQKGAGIKKRQQQLENHLSDQALAIQAEDLFAMNQAKLREQFNGKKVVYIYHNYIDAIGDNAKTENDVLRAAEAAIEQLLKLMNRLTVELSVNQFLVTADHGFLFSNDPLHHSEKALVESTEQVLTKNKRFLITKESLNKEVGLSLPVNSQLHDQLYVTVPRGLNRFALKGGGAQYVHGGYLPQEIIVPLLKIKTDRTRNELEKVGISLITQTRRIINTVLWLSLLQMEPISENKHKRYLKVYFEDASESILSNEVSIIADKEANSSDQRVFNEKFVFLENKTTRNDDCYLIIKDEKSREIILREHFNIDLI